MAGVRGLAAAGELLQDELVQPLGELDRDGVEGDGDDPVVTDTYLVGAHAADPRQGLREQQREQSRDAGVEPDGLVMQQQLDLCPPVLVSEGDLGEGSWGWAS